MVATAAMDNTQLVPQLVLLVLLVDPDLVQMILLVVLCADEVQQALRNNRCDSR